MSGRRGSFTLSTMCAGRALRHSRAPGSPLLIVLTPRFFRHWRRSAPNPDNDTVEADSHPSDLRPALWHFTCSNAFASDRPGSNLSFQTYSLPRKEVIQPHLPIRLPCYDFTPVINLTFVRWPLTVTSLPSGAINSHGVTGGVYKARERIHRDMMIRDY